MQVKRRNLVFRHGILSIGFVLVYLFLNRPEIILVTHLGLTAWFPAVGLVFALMLGVSPWYVFLACFADSLAGMLIYHQPFASWSIAAAPVASLSFYAAAAILLRGSLRIDLGLRRRRDVMRFVGVTLCAAIGATVVGVLSVIGDHSIGWNQFWSSAFAWYVGDAVGLLGFAPFLLIHVLPWVRKWLSPSESGAAKKASTSKLKNQVARTAFVAEAIGQCVSILLLLWILFAPTLAHLQLFYLSFIPIVWVAMRHGVRRVVTAILVLNFGIVAALHFFTTTPNVVAKIGLLMLVVSATGLFIGSSVSERHRMASELHGRTLYLHSLIENSPAGIVVLNRQGTVELCNDAFESLFQYRKQELMGKPFGSLISGSSEDDRSNDLMARVVSGERVNRSERRTRKDGTLIDIEVSAVPLIVGGQVQGAFAIYNDVSSQVKVANDAKQHAESLKRWVNELQLFITFNSRTMRPHKSGTTVFGHLNKASQARLPPKSVSLWQT